MSYILIFVILCESAPSCLLAGPASRSLTSSGAAVSYLLSTDLLQRADCESLRFVFEAWGFTSLTSSPLIPLLGLLDLLLNLLYGVFFLKFAEILQIIGLNWGFVLICLQPL